MVLNYVGKLPGEPRGRRRSTLAAVDGLLAKVFGLSDAQDSDAVLCVLAGTAACQLRPRVLTLAAARLWRHPPLARACFSVRRDV